MGVKLLLIHTECKTTLVKTFSHTDTTGTRGGQFSLLAQFGRFFFPFWEHIHRVPTLKAWKIIASNKKKIICKL